MLSLLQPLPTTTPRIGSVISKTQPDVEVLALCLEDVPHTVQDFHTKRGARDYLICKFLVIAVGTPGFAKVPYLSKKRKGEKEDASKPLYESAGLTFEGKVRMHAFEKGPTNKDKGERVEGESTTGVLCPGVCLAFFIREEMYEVGKIMASSTIERSSQVCLQVASSNIDSANKGYLLKLKKIKQLDRPFSLESFFKLLPTSEMQYEALINHTRETYGAMRGSLDSNTDSKFFAVEQLGGQAFAVLDDDGFVICNAKGHNQEGFADEIAVSREMALVYIGCPCEKKALLVLNIALAMNSISVLIKSSVGSTIALNSDKISPPMSVMAMHWNQNVFLRLDDLARPDVAAALGELMSPASKTPLPLTFLHHTVGDLTVSGYKGAASAQWSLTYGHKLDRYCDHLNKAYHIEFQVVGDEACHDDETEEATSYLSVHGSGPHNQVHVVLRPMNEDGPGNKLITLQLRRDKAAVGMKRKRPNIYLFDGED